MAEQNEYCFIGKDLFWSLIISELSKEGKMAEWISVDERLPKPFEEAIVYRGKDNIMCVDMFNGKSWAKDGLFETFGKPSQVTHWQPLPSPPKPNEPTVNKVEAPKTEELPKATYESYNSHDCEAFYRCPICNKTFGAWSYSEEEKKCPWCKSKIRIK